MTLPATPATVTQGGANPAGAYNDLRALVDALRTNMGASIDTTLTGLGFTDIAEALDTASGQEMAYAQRTSNFTNNNDNAALIHQNLITGLSISVTGTGRPVLLEFYANVRNSTANNAVGVGLVVNGQDPTVQALLPLGQVSSPSTSSTRILYLPGRVVIPDGVSWTIEVGVWGNTGTKTFEGSSQVPIWLAATQR